MEPKQNLKPEEVNKAIIQQMSEATRLGGLTAQADFFDDRVTNHGIPVTRDAIRAVLEDICTTFPNAVLEPIHIVAEGEWVAMRGYFSGTHDGVGQHPFVHEGLLAAVPATVKASRCSTFTCFVSGRASLSSTGRIVMMLA